MEALNFNVETKKIYWTNTYLFNYTAKLVDIQLNQKDENTLKLIFNETIFHPQGGGQPSDFGFIKKDFNEIEVFNVEINKENGVIYHYVKKNIFEKLEFKINDEVLMSINEENRRINAKLHSAGHFLDSVISYMKLNFIPGKGYHFPDGPYVEYEGKVDKSKIGELISEFNETIQKIISQTEENNNSLIFNFNYEEGRQYFNDNLPSYLPINKPFRWVKLYKDDIGCPCSGTHVTHISELKEMKILKLTNKGKKVRISYNL